LLAQSQIFVFPARRDEPVIRITYDRLNRAMASGLPIVTSRLAGIPEIITDQINGILVPQRAPEALASAIRSLLLDSKKREKLGASGLSTAREKFSLAATVQELIAIFESQIRRTRNADCGSRNCFDCPSAPAHSAIRVPHSAFPPCVSVLQ